MTDKDALSRSGFFISYQLLLGRIGPVWLTKDNESIAVYHVLCAIRPESLRVHLGSRLELSRYGLRMDLEDSVVRGIKLPNGFQHVEIGVSCERRKNRDTRDRKKKDDTTASEKSRDVSARIGNSKAGNLPVCYYGTHTAKGYRHYLKGCMAYPDDEKKKLCKRLTESNPATEPFRSSFSKRSAHMTRAENNVAGRVNASQHAAHRPSCSASEIARRSSKQRDVLMTALTSLSSPLELLRAPA